MNEEVTYDEMMLERSIRDCIARVQRVVPNTSTREACGILLEIIRKTYEDDSVENWGTDSPHFVSD